LIQAPRNSATATIRRTIERRGISCYALAQATGIDRRNIERFVSGESAPSARTIDLLLSALGLVVIEAGKRPGSKGAAEPIPLDQTVSMGAEGGGEPAIAVPELPDLG
jgi:transcriptional regulator with XRE-family HTH domain